MKPIEQLKNAPVQQLLQKLYHSREAVEAQQGRYEKAIRAFDTYFPNKAEISVYSAPGRTEIGGNHTDHQHGCVLGGAVSVDAIAVVAFHHEGVVRVQSEGYEPVEIQLSQLQPNPAETGTAALVRGVLAKFRELGVEADGFDMYVTSDVISGGGISSSATFEVLVATVINDHYNGGNSSPFELAQIGWYAENVFFGKKCGLLDQTVAAYGGLVCVDFADPSDPKVEKIAFDFEANGYTICITDTKSSHENLTADYSAIPEEMGQIAAAFGCKVLNQVDETAFYEKLPELRKTCSDRAILRAMHFFAETKRAREEADALKNKDVEAFLALVNASGESSANLLQNLYATHTPSQQAIPLAIAVSKAYLQGKGAVRVHGGGFAGTIQAFVPTELAEGYCRQMEGLFGKGACYQMGIRPVGGVKIF